MELNDGAFTIVVANDDADGLQARELARGWYADGLLGEFGWVTPNDVSRPTFGPATVLTTVIGHDEPRELMSLLGARPRRLIRVIVLHLLTHEHSRADRLVGACDQIAALVERALPVQVRAHDGRRATRLLRVNLLVPESDLLPQSTDVIQAGWEINAVVSPEDRPDLDRMNVFVRRSENLSGHGLAAAASVGGLWRGIDVGAFDDFEPDSTTGGRELVVMRSTARLVVGDDRSPELLDKVIQAVQRPEEGAANLLSWGVPADNPRAVIEDSVKRLLERRDWAPQEREVTPLEKTQLSLATIVRNWALFQVLLPIAAAKYLLGIGRSVVEQSVTAATVGRGAGEEGRLRPLTPEQAEAVARYRMQETAEQLTPHRLREEASSWGQTTPVAWRELRELAIGLVDGSPLPSGFTRRQRAGLDEVLPPSFVVPAPENQVPVVGHQDLHPLDIQGVADLSEAIAAEAKRPPSEDEESTSLPESDDTGREAPSELDRLTAWLDGCRDSLMWQLASHVNSFRMREVRQVERAQETLANARVPSTGWLRFARTLVTLSWAVTLLAVLLLVLLIWNTAEEDAGWLLERLPEIDWVDGARVVAIILGLLLAAGTFYFQKLREYEWRVTQRIHHLRLASDEYVAARQQEKRWAIMYQGVQDWGSILAEVLHRPWAPLPHPEGEIGAYEGLPAAVAVAAPVEDGAGPDQRLVARAAESVCQRGWLTNEFLEILEHCPRNDPSTVSLSGDLPADLDLGLRPHGARRELAQVAATEKVKLDACQRLRAEIVELVSSGEIRMPTQTVRRVGPYSVGDHVPDTDFFTASAGVDAPLARDLFDPESLVMGYNIPERVVLCLPLGSAPPDLDSAEVHSCGAAAAMRVDISPLLHPGRLRLFTEASRLEPYVPPASDDFN